MRLARTCVKRSSLLLNLNPMLQFAAASRCARMEVLHSSFSQSPAVTRCRASALTALFCSSWSAGVPACGRPLPNVSECSQCAAERTALVLLDERRKKEQTTVSSIDRMHLEPGEFWCGFPLEIHVICAGWLRQGTGRYIIDRQWLMDWLDFVNQGGPVRRLPLP